MNVISLKGKALLFALVLAALPVGMTSRVSAGVVPSFSISPTSILEGGTSTVHLHLDLFADPGAALNMDFVGGSVTLFSGYGPSMTFGIGSEGIITLPENGPVTRDFSATFTYSTAGVLHPSFEGEAYYIMVFADGSSFEPRFGLRGSADLNVLAATPIPATLPLFGTGLGLMGFMGWWRKKRAETAV